MAVTFAVAVVPVSAGKVMVAAWPTVTLAMSASAMFAVTMYDETSAMVTKAELLALLALDELAPPESARAAGPAAGRATDLAVHGDDEPGDRRGQSGLRQVRLGLVVGGPRLRRRPAWPG